ncbi:MAG: alpha/beta hydrolase [Sphingobacteriales bacterium]|nr:MAG: alpha/beta hydrolase [Sphingobacteriales bacterium]
MPFFENNFVRLHYYQYGIGKQILIAFHGFGMRGNQFAKLEDALGNKYTIYSFDLFFHGQTQLSDDTVNTIRKGFDTSQIANAITEFLTSINQPESPFSLLSYSIGAKLALALLVQMPQRVKKAYFIAADGFETNTVLKICSSRYINNWLLKLVYHPKTLHYILKKLYQLGYIDEALHRILSFEFSTQAYRMVSYKTITYYSRLRFNKIQLAQIINKNHIETHFFFGKYDKLFPAGIAYRFGKLLRTPHIHIFNQGHELINDELNNYLKTIL